jgi:transposase
VSATDSQTISITEAARRLGISRGVAYKVAKRDGELARGLPVLMIAGQQRVSVMQLEKLLSEGHPPRSDDDLNDETPHQEDE